MKKEYQMPTMERIDLDRNERIASSGGPSGPGLGMGNPFG